jgi:MFS family permease
MPTGPQKQPPLTNAFTPGERVLAYGMMLDRATSKDLRLAIVSIVFGILFFVITGYPGASPLFTAYLKGQLGISDSAYGLILTLPYLTVLIQVPYSYFVARYGRIKEAFLIFAILAKTMIIVPAVMPLLRPDMKASSAVWVIGIVIFLLSLFNWIADSALNTWFGAMIPSEIKGRYFSTRQMLFTLAMLFYATAMSFLLKMTENFPLRYTVFFIAASLFGIIDVCMYIGARPPEKAFLPWHHASQATQSLASFLSPVKDKRYRAYLLFAVSWNFSIQVSGPYYNVYLLNTLHVSLGMMTFLTQIIPAIATVLFLRNIGRAYDQYGFRPVLLLACSISILLPFSWLFATPASHWFIYPVNVLSGIFNSGIDMAIMSLAIFLAPHDQRNPYLAVKNIVMSMLGIVPAILLGGILSDWLEPVLAHARLPFFRGQVVQPFHIILLLSIAMRILTLLVFTRRLSEPTAHTFSEFIKEAQAAGKLTFEQQKRRQQRTIRALRRKLRK